MSTNAALDRLCVPFGTGHPTSSVSPLGPGTQPALCPRWDRAPNQPIERYSRRSSVMQRPSGRAPQQPQQPQQQNNQPISTRRSWVLNRGVETTAQHRQLSAPPSSFVRVPLHASHHTTFQASHATRLFITPGTRSHSRALYVTFHAWSVEASPTSRATRAGYSSGAQITAKTCTAAALCSCAP
jgi:hypothetical protein